MVTPPLPFPGGGGGACTCTLAGEWIEVDLSGAVRSDDIVDLPPNTALAVRAPVSCGERCDAPFVNPRGPE